MRAESNTNHLKKKYVSFIGGPILFTAPHSKRLMRGGELFKQKKRIHYRQTYTSWITLRLAQITRLSKKEPNSFCFWGKSKQINQEDLDPNYLLPKLLQTSPFHLCLHAWALKHHKYPIFHVDIHGKLNRKNDCEIELGIESLRFYWKEDPLIKITEQYFENVVVTVFKGLQFRGFKVTINADPCLHGLWGGYMQTMTEQASHLGIPTCQMEIPEELRKKLFKDNKLLERFGESIKAFYLQKIVPYYQSKTKPLNISKELGIKFKTTIMDQKQIQQLQEQVKILESKESLDLNLKKI